MGAKSKHDDEKGGQVFNIQGGVHAKRDVIMGDQNNIITNNTANIESPAQFVEALKQVQAQVAGIKQEQLTAAQKRNLEAVEGQIEAVSLEAGKPKPQLAHIQTTLKDARETMDMLAGGLNSAAALGTTIGGLALLAVKLFGG